MHWQSIPVTVEGGGQQAPRTPSLAEPQEATAFTGHSLCQRSRKNVQRDHLPAELTLRAANFTEPKRSPQGARGAEKRNMFKVNLRDSKTGHEPHSNPRDAGKSPKVVVRFKNWTHLVSQKTQHVEISGITGKIVREMFTEIEALRLKRIGAETHPLCVRHQRLLLLRAGIQWAEDTKWLYRATVQTLLLGQGLGLSRFKRPCEACEQQIPKVQRSGPSFPDTTSNA